MKITFNWLKQFLDTDACIDQISDKLTQIGLEIDAIYSEHQDISDVTIGQILEFTKHPNADSLHLCKVDVGDHILDIICGANNLYQNMKVAVAQVGTTLPHNIKIKKTKIRGVPSHGMLCSKSELNLCNDHSEGIMDLNSDAPVGKSLVSYLGLDDVVLDINITPNRGDAFSVYGIARDLAAAGMGHLKKIEKPEIIDEHKSDISINIRSDKCSIFCIREINNIHAVDTPLWIKKFIEAVGISAHSAVIDIAKYIEHSFGQPLHIYNRKSVGSNLVIDELKNQIIFDGLDNNQYKLSVGDLVVTDDSYHEIYCLAGVIGSNDSKYVNTNDSIIVESAHFDKHAIASTSRRLSVDSSSKMRFERGVDSNMTQDILNYATNLIHKTCGGAVSNLVVVSNDTSSHRQINILFDYNFVEQYIGISIDREMINQILTNLGFIYTVRDNELDITPPTWRSDVTCSEDICEEIIRIYGYDKIKPIILPNITNFSVSTLPEDVVRYSRLKRLIASMNYNELISWSFMNPKDLENFAEYYDDLLIRNPISENLSYMRPTLVPNLLAAISSNFKRSFHSLAFFEIGEVFRVDQGNIIEEKVLTAIRTGYVNYKDECKKENRVDFFDVKKDLEKLLITFGINLNNIKIDNINSAKFYHPYRSYQILFKKDIIGSIGQIHPSIVQKYDMKQNIFVFEIYISKLCSIKNNKKSNTIHYSNYQITKRDYSFLINKNIALGEVIKSVQNNISDLIKSVTLFDIYDNKDISSDEISISFSVEIQSSEGNLTTEILDVIDNNIIDMMHNNFNASLRK